MKPTVLNLFVIDGYKIWDENYILSSALEKIREIRAACNYTFVVPLPVGIEAHRSVKKELVRKLFGGNKIVETPQYHYNLIFDKELTEEELNFWRMFKMGWRAAKWPRY